MDGGKAEVGLESTVLDLSGGQPTILRPGVLTRSELQSKLETPIILKSELETEEEKGTASASQPSPGMSPVHYAPATPLHLHRNMDELLKMNISRVRMWSWSPIIGILQFLRKKSSLPSPGGQ